MNCAQACAGRSFCAGCAAPPRLRPGTLFAPEGEITSSELVGVMRGHGDGSFPLEYPGPIGPESPFRIASDIDAVDVSGDGYPDLVLTSNAPNDISVPRQRRRHTAGAGPV
jgi:hypothetical protein